MSAKRADRRAVSDVPVAESDVFEALPSLSPLPSLPTMQQPKVNLPADLGSIEVTEQPSFPPPAPASQPAPAAPSAAAPVSYAQVGPSELTLAAASPSIAAPLATAAPLPVPAPFNPAAVAGDQAHAAAPAKRWWHTLIPRLLWVAGMLMALGVAIGFLLSDGGSKVPDLDEDGTRTIAGLIVMGVAAMYVGAMWWAVSAAVNARRRTPLGVSPFLAPAFHGLLPGIAAVLVAKFVSHETLDEPSTVSLIVWAGSIGLFVLHLLVIKGYRATAGRLHADVEPWSYLLFGPMVMVGLAVSLHGLRTFVAGPTVESFVRYAAFGAALAFTVGYVRAVWAASGSFDRACRRTGSAELSNADKELQFGQRLQLMPTGKPAS